MRGELGAWFGIYERQEFSVVPIFSFLLARESAKGEGEYALVS